MNLRQDTGICPPPSPAQDTSSSTTWTSLGAGRGAVPFTHRAPPPMSATDRGTPPEHPDRALMACKTILQKQRNLTLPSFDMCVQYNRNFITRDNENEREIASTPAATT